MDSMLTKVYVVATVSVVPDLATHILSHKTPNGIRCAVGGNNSSPPRNIIHVTKRVQREAG